MTSSEEEIAASLLDCQHQLIARVVLAGWTFESREDVRRVNAGWIEPKDYRSGKRDGWQTGSGRRWHAGDKVVFKQYRAVSPEVAPGTGATIHTAWFGDKYGACCEAYSIMEASESASESEYDGLFEVRE